MVEGFFASWTDPCPFPRPNSTAVPWLSEPGCLFTDATDRSSKDTGLAASERLQGHAFYLGSFFTGVVFNHLWMLLVLRFGLGLQPSKVPGWARFPQVSESVKMCVRERDNDKT